MDKNLVKYLIVGMFIISGLQLISTISRLAVPVSEEIIVSKVTLGPDDYIDLDLNQFPLDEWNIASFHGFVELNERVLGDGVYILLATYPESGENIVNWIHGTSSSYGAYDEGSTESIGVQLFVEPMAGGIPINTLRLIIVAYNHVTHQPNTNIILVTAGVTYESALWTETAIYGIIGSAITIVGALVMIALLREGSDELWFEPPPRKEIIDKNCANCGYKLKNEVFCPACGAQANQHTN
jgi:hypothetical protein